MKLRSAARVTGRFAVLAALVLPLVVTAAPTPTAPAKASAKASPKAPTNASASAPTTPAKPDVTQHPKFRGYINDVPDTGQFLADSVWLLRVGPRVTTTYDFVERWFAAYPPDRPSQDSAGRVQFLSSMRDRDVLALTATQIGKPLAFEDRHELREARQRALVQAVFQRYVRDSVQVTEADTRALYETYRWDQHVRHLLVGDRPTAERVRRELIAGRITWAAAVKKYSLAKDAAAKDGDLGWLQREKLDVPLANLIYALNPGEYSIPIQDPLGWHIVQSVERRPRTVAPYEAVQRRAKQELIAQQTSLYMEKLNALLREQEGLRFDTLNCLFASQQFRVAVKVDREGLGGTINVDEHVPEFSNADTGRVLATWRGSGRYTVEQLVHAYSDAAPLLRPTLNSPEMIMAFVEAIVLEPAVAEYGEKHGLEKEPSVQAAIAKKTEEIMVGHLYQDSVARFIWVSKEERRKQYDQHLASYHTYPKVEFAAITRTSKAGADSVEKALHSGVKPQAILAADSAGGRVSGSIQMRSQAEQGAYHAALFNELRPGDIQVRGPDREGVYVVIQSLAYDPGRQLSYEECESMIDESLQNAKTDASLRAFIKRHTSRYAIAWRPELVQLIRLVDPSLQ